MKQPNNLGTDRVSSLILKLMIPSMIAQLVNVLYSIVDRIYIGNIPDTGALALAGAGICGPIVTFLSSFGTLVGLGGSILFSIRLGEGKKESARQILNNCFLLLVLLSLVLTLAFLLLRRPLLYCFGASDMVFPYADTYMSIYTAGTFFALLSAGLNYFITCQGHPLLGMMTVMIGAILNLILDPLFIFGFGMGIAGAAVATVLSQITSCLFVFFVLFGHKVSIRIGFGSYQPKLMGRIILLGLSPFLILATDSLIMIAFNAMLQRYGGARSDMLIACATIVQSYMLLITAPMLGITGGCQPIISYNYGARQPDRVREAVRRILTACLIFTGVMFLISQIFPLYFVRIFTQDASYITLTVWAIRVFTLSIIPLSLQYTFVDSLTALGASHVSLPLSLLRKGLYFALICVLPIVYTADTIFYAEPLADAAAAVFSTVTFLFLFPRWMAARSTASRKSTPK